MCEGLPVQNAILDGDILHLDANGIRPFWGLMRRRPHHFYAFDLLWHDGRDLRGLPLVDRKRLLRQDVPAFQAVCDITGSRSNRAEMMNAVPRPVRARSDRESRCRLWYAS